jgi:hypothetical protein
VDPTEEPETKSSIASEITVLQVASKIKFFDQFKDNNFSRSFFRRKHGNNNPIGSQRASKMPTKIHLSTALREFLPLFKLRSQELQKEATSARGTSPNARTPKRSGRPCDIAERRS